MPQFPFWKGLYRSSKIHLSDLLERCNSTPAHTNCQLRWRPVPPLAAPTSTALGRLVELRPSAAENKRPLLGSAGLAAGRLAWGLPNLSASVRAACANKSPCLPQQHKVQRISVVPRWVLTVKSCATAFRASCLRNSTACGAPRVMGCPGWVSRLWQLGLLCPCPHVLTSTLLTCYTNEAACKSLQAIFFFFL